MPPPRLTPALRLTSSAPIVFGDFAKPESDRAVRSEADDCTIGAAGVAKTSVSAKRVEDDRSFQMDLERWGQ